MPHRMEIPSEAVLQPVQNSRTIRNNRLENSDGIFSIWRNSLVITFFDATSSTSSLSCSIVPVATAWIFCSRSSARLENFGKSFSPTSSLTRTTPPLLRHCRDRWRLLDVVPKSITILTWPLHASMVRSMSCFSYKSSFHWTTLTLCFNVCKK